MSEMYIVKYQNMFGTIFKETKTPPAYSRDIVAVYKVSEVGTPEMTIKYEPPSDVKENPDEN